MHRHDESYRSQAGRAAGAFQAVGRSEAWRLSTRELDHVEQPADPNPQPPALVAVRLAEACRHPSHAFWPASIGLLEEGLICWENLLGPRQITDADVLALAVMPAASGANLCVIACD